MSYERVCVCVDSSYSAGNPHLNERRTQETRRYGSTRDRVA